MASSRIWAGLLDGIAAAARFLYPQWAAGFGPACCPPCRPRGRLLLVSGIARLAVVSSVVASTTALVRHSRSPPIGPDGIAAFTTVFAAGQIIGPVMVGWIC